MKVYGALARSEALATGHPDWMNVTEWGHDDDLDAVRHPKRGRAHRPVYGAPAGVLPNDRGETTACGAPIRHLTERIKVSQTAPEDRCRSCW